MISFLSLPWNQQILLGWILEILFTALSALSYFLIYSIFLSFFIAICGFHRAFRECFQTTVEQINYIQHVNASAKMKLFKLKLCEAIRFHVMAKK